MHSVGETHCELGQHIGSGSHPDANHVLEPEGERGCHSRARAALPLTGHPSRPHPWPSDLSHSLGARGRRGWGGPWAPSRGQGQGRAGTHPKCCTTLGSMAASCSMEGYWYLREGRGQAQARPRVQSWGRLEGAPGYLPLRKLGRSHLLARGVHVAHHEVLGDLLHVVRVEEGVEAQLVCKDTPVAELGRGGPGSGRAGEAEASASQSSGETRTQLRVVRPTGPWRGRGGLPAPAGSGQGTAGAEGTHLRLRPTSW